MEKPEVDKKEAVLVEVPTQMGVAMKLDTGEIVDANQMLCLIYNKVLKLEKNLL